MRVDSFSFCFEASPVVLKKNDHPIRLYSFHRVGGLSFSAKAACTLKGLSGSRALFSLNHQKRSSFCNLRHLVHLKAFLQGFPLEVGHQSKFVRSLESTHL